MKKLLLTLFFFSSLFSQAQIICIFCYDQNDSISYNVQNLMLNGGFENTTCTSISDSYCPNSSYYNCDIANWTCTGGGSSTYACIVDSNFYSTMIEGIQVAYFGNSFCSACSPIGNDTSCLTDTACMVTGIPTGYPLNSANGYGGNVGVNLEQTVTGLTIGNTYILEFWTGGEWPTSYPNRGLFAVDVGFGKTFLRNSPYHTPSMGNRFIIEFNAVSTSHTIRFTSWGHICSNCTELFLDDVKLYTLAELSPAVPSCSNPIAGFNAPNNICPGTCTNFTNLSLQSTLYLWSFPGAVPANSTDANPINICYSTPGNYDVQLIASNGNGSDTLLLPNYITVYPSPAPQAIIQSYDTLFANTGAASYQWYFNGNIINGATNYFYIAPASGNYNVVAADANGCEVEAAIFDVVADIHVEAANDQFGIFPNPIENKLLIQYLQGNGNQLKLNSISIYNLIGEKVLAVPLLTANCIFPIGLDCQLLPPGIYFLELISDNKIFRTKFVKS